MQTKRPGLFYDSIRVLVRGVFAMTMRSEVDGLHHLPQTGGCLIAVCHLNNLDPIVVSALVPRRIGWMSRVEFVRHWFMRPLLHFSGAFPVHRQGYARPALRESLQRLADGEIVGIFPEGEIMSGPASVLRQGRVRSGTAWLAARSGRPVIPVLILGTDRLTSVGPWLPARRGRLWLTAGTPLTAPPQAHTRAGRAAFTARLEEEFRRLYRETRQQYQLPDTIVP
jgi:1-acyl-sn-glycerol-3-phosphate acyltransferase